MTLLDLQGFDDSNAEANVALGASVNLNNSTSRTGVGGSGSMSSTASTITITVPASATLVTGFGFRTNGSYGTTNSWFLIMEGTTVHLSLRFNASGQIDLYRGDGTTLLATSTWTAPPVATWFYVEVKATIADSGGTCEVRVGGAATGINFSGDTRNAGATGVPDRVRFNCPGTSTATLVDDVYILNTSGATENDFLGDWVVRTLVGVANGDSSNFVGSDGNSVDNYLLVDEANSSMTDYVGSATSGHRDLYVMGDIPADYDVRAVQEVVLAQASDGGTPPVLRPVAKGQLGTVRPDASLPTLSTTPILYRSEIRTTDPDGNALTAARVNAMQVGVEIL